MKSSSAKDSNKVLSYEYVFIIKVRDAKNPSRTIIIVKMNLMYIKNFEDKNRRLVLISLDQNLNITYVSVIEKSLSFVLKVY